MYEHLSGFGLLASSIGLGSKENHLYITVSLDIFKMQTLRSVPFGFLIVVKG